MKIMILRVTNSDVDYGSETYKISLMDFGCKEYHPFIASNKWEKVYIDITEDTPKGIIRQVIPMLPICPVLDTDNISKRMLFLLCEVFNDEAYELVSLYTTDFSKFKERVINLIKERNANI